MEIGVTCRLFHPRVWYLGGNDSNAEDLHKDLTAWWPQGNQISCMVTAFLQNKCPKKTSRSFMAFSDLASDVMQCHFYYILLVRVVPIPPRFKGRGHRPYLSVGEVSKNFVAIFFKSTRVIWWIWGPSLRWNSMRRGRVY